MPASGRRPATRGERKGVETLSVTTNGGVCAHGGGGMGRRLTVNLSNCKYDVVREVTSAAGYAEVDDGDENWDLYWTDFSVSEARVSKMRPYQRINHFPGMMEICRKAALSRNLKRMQARMPEHYSFAPTTWDYPAELDAFRRYSRVHPDAVYIVKPTAGSMGRGIYLVRGEGEIDPHEKNVVIQRYVSKPLLLDGFKFDLRVYALVTCVDPLTVYVYDEGIARFATIQYEPPNAQNVGARNMHLTNYSVNKCSDAFIHADDEGEGTKRALTALMRELGKRGCDAQALWAEICDVIVRTILPIQPHLAHTYHAAVTNGPGGGSGTCGGASRPHPAGGQRGESTGSESRGGDVSDGGDPSREGGGGGGGFRTTDAAQSRCFELLGFDVMLDEGLRPWLLEVNHSPSFSVDSPLDRRIKTGLLGDLMEALRLDPRDRRAWLAMERRQQQDRLYNTTLAPWAPGVSLKGRLVRQGASHSFAFDPSLTCVFVCFLITVRLYMSKLPLYDRYLIHVYTSVEP